MFLIPTLVLLLGASVAPVRSDGGTIRYVDNLTRCADLVPCYTTIMAAVDAAASLDTIEVFPGVYHESVGISSKGSITLRGHGQGAMPTIVARNANAIDIQGSFVRIVGFVLEAPAGAGVSANGGAAGALIEDNIISSQTGIFFRIAQGTVRNNTIIGGGITGSGSGACLVENNTVIGNGVGFGDFNGGPRGNQVLGNVVLKGDISFNGRPTVQNVAASNLVFGGGITASGYFCTANLIQANVVRGGYIRVSFGAAQNHVEDNFVSGGSGIQLHVFSSGGGNFILRNTSVENSGCDLNDFSEPMYFVNHWEDNRYRTACGAAGSTTP
jgi:hypothetical protein